MMQHLDTIEASSGLLESVDYDQSDPQDLLARVWQRFGARVAIGTSFQRAGLVLIDMVARASISMRVFTIDTLRLPIETHRLIHAIRERYAVQIEMIAPDSSEVAAMVQEHGEHLFFDSHDKRRLCCRVRKEKPTARIMQSLDVWITGVRRDGCDTRSETPKAQVINKYGKPVLKLAPLADWSDARVQSYLEEHDVPQSALYAQGYASIGCVTCTSPVLPGEPPRTGRWRWEKDGQVKECGLHLSGGAGI